MINKDAKARMGNLLWPDEYDPNGDKPAFDETRAKLNLANVAPEPVKDFAKELETPIGEVSVSTKHQQPSSKRN